MAVGAFITPIGSSSGGTTIIPNAAYLNTVSGNDSTAVLGDSTKPYLTMTALIAALPVTNDFTWTINITGATLDITMPTMPDRSLIFNADIKYIYNFNFNNANVNGNIISTIYAGFFTWTFLTGNINLKSDASVLRILGNGYQSSSGLQIQGTINIIDWLNEGVNGTTVAMNNSNVTINEYIRRTAASGIFIGNPIYTRFKKITYIGFYGGIIKSVNTYLSKIIIDLVSCANTADIELVNNSSNLEIELKQIQITGVFGINAGLAKLTLNNLICSGTTTSMYLGEVSLITGKVVSSTPITYSRQASKTFQNLEATITGNLSFWTSTLTVDNCRLTVTDYLAKCTGTNIKQVIFKGNNIIKQNSVQPLIQTISGANHIVDIEGTLNLLPGYQIVDTFGTVNYLTSAVPSYVGPVLASPLVNII